ncbi:uncharacterized protein LOC125071461 isoform X1 [Vanessa atalanta]|uniref:uncharacterized protein LOC125071461 isoform X1 n=1 Tax=Vanessa atalanta TaxID=42275 RepID=UPI001FCDA112|nr:uncharacterized protein LOC125071461 isoform X1 [Vanessa atalanta]
MLPEARSCILYSAVILSLFVIDYLLGNGFVVTFQKLFCKVVCGIRKDIKEERSLLITGNEHFINLPVLCSEIVFLALTIAFLNKYKQHSSDNIDDLLRESRDVLRQTNEFLEKWRLRRINWQVPNEYSYLDEEPQEIKPYKLEVPILHMAIVDTLGSTRNRSERGDAGDMVSSMDTMLLSMTNLIDDDLQSIPEILGEENIDMRQEIEFQDRFLWDVLEEDSSLEEF